MATKKSKSKPSTTTPKPQAQATATATPTPDDQVKRRYRLTGDFKTKQGVVHKKGTAFDVTAEEVKRRKMPAERVND